MMPLVVTQLTKGGKQYPLRCGGRFLPSSYLLFDSCSPRNNGLAAALTVVQHGNSKR